METLSRDTLGVILSCLDNGSIANLRVVGKMFADCREMRANKRQRLTAILKRHLTQRGLRVVGGSRDDTHNSYFMRLPVGDTIITSCLLMIKPNRVCRMIYRSSPDSPGRSQWIVVCHEDVPVTWEGIHRDTPSI